VITSVHVCAHFFLSKQPDILIIQIYSVIKLYMFLAPSLEAVIKTCMKLTSAESAVQNS
jgi:hypothetical protein